jgi:hypothetical protein
MIDGSQDRSRRANVDFPAPDGDDRMMSKPRLSAMSVLPLPDRYALQLHGFDRSGQPGHLPPGRGPKLTTRQQFTTL